MCALAQPGENNTLLSVKIPRYRGLARAQKLSMLSQPLEPAILRSLPPPMPLISGANLQGEKALQKFKDLKGKDTKLEHSL